MDAHYIWFAFLWKMYKKNVFLIQNCAAIRKKSHYGFKAYPHPNILISLANWTTYMLPYWSKNAFFFLSILMLNGEELVLPPSTFQSGEGNCPQLLLPWGSICEVRTADSYRACWSGHLVVFVLLNLQFFVN